MSRKFVFSVFLLATTSLAAIAQQISDPTRRPDAVVQPGQSEEKSSASSRDSLKLQAIRIGSAHRSAIINGDIVEVGTSLEEGWRVTAINASGVQLRSESDAFTLRLPSLSMNHESSQQGPRTR